MVEDLGRILGSQRQALKLTGLSRATWHYRRRPRPGTPDPIPHTQRDNPSRLSQADRDQICEHIMAAWAREESVDHAFATAWDAGVMLGSRRTWWRIAAEIEDQMLRPTTPTKETNRAPRKAPVVKATAPNQAWSWDITDLYSPWRGKVFKAYKITDIYSRHIVGWCVEEREADHLAVELFETAITEHGAPEVVHADSGAAMRSNRLRDFLDTRGVEMSHNRPHVSNDNPFSEAGFKTMKYRPGYPKVFTDLDHARTYLDGYVDWYNNEHKHSGIALFTPAQVHDGTWEQAWRQRDTALQGYYAQHPERYRRPPTTPTPASIVGINLPPNASETHAA